MRTSRSVTLITRLVASIVITYGLVVIASALLRQLQVHRGRDIDVLLITVPQVVGLGFVYLGNLLLRRKYNAWLAALVLFGVEIASNITHDILRHDSYSGWRVSLGLPALIVVLLVFSRSAFRVRSDVRSFTQAVRVSFLILLVALVYGVGGFSLLNDHDFHHEISVPTAVHQTIDQAGLTTDHPVAYTRRARLFLDSLPVISIAAISYVAISLFVPIKVRLASHGSERVRAVRLLRDYRSDIDDYFKLWPRDKLYYFDISGEAALAYHVTRGVALVVGNPFGNSGQFRRLLEHFQELCFVNDWLPAFIHVDDEYRNLYEGLGCRMQKIGEEAILDLRTWPEAQAGKKGKYFREIRNRFDRLGYTAEITSAPHDEILMTRLEEISREWLARPGRTERGFMLGHFSPAYLSQCDLVLLRDASGIVQGFANLVPTFEVSTANYDLLRCSTAAPGNANDFLLMKTLDALCDRHTHTFNLGLSPLAGVDDPDSKDTTIVDSALRIVYSNGDRLYSFSGLHRFKAKYNPDWQPRYIAYPGSVASFTRIVTALNRAMKIKNKRP